MKNPKKISVVFLLLIFCNNILAQKNWKIFIPINFDAGANVGKLDQDFNSFTQQLGYSIALSSGLMLRYKDKIGLATEIGLGISEYNFISQGLFEIDTYSFALISSKTQIRPFVLIPLKNNPHAVLRIQLSAGYNFLSNDNKSELEGSISANAYTKAQNLAFIMPEIGLTKILKKSQLDLGLTYRYNFSKGEVLGAEMTNILTNNKAYFSSNLNYLALSFNVSPEIFLKSKKIKKSKTEIEKEPITYLSDDILSRTNRNRFTYEFKRRNITIKVWDDAEIDGDTISIALNNQIILDNYGLIRDKKKIKIKLNPGENILTVVAHNLGTVPPNTAAIEIKSGLKNYFLISSTNLQRNEEIKLIYKNSKHEK